MTARNRAVLQGSTPKMEKALNEADQEENHANAQTANSQHANNSQAGLRRVEQHEELRDGFYDPVTDKGEDLKNGRSNATGAREQGDRGQHS